MYKFLIHGLANHTIEDSYAALDQSPKNHGICKPSLL